MVLTHGFPSSNSVADLPSTAFQEPPELFADPERCSEGLELREGGALVSTAVGAARGTSGRCVALDWPGSGPLGRVECVVEQVGFQVGFGVMVTNVGSDLRKLLSYPHCWRGGVVLFNSGAVLMNNGVVGNTGAGYGTFENGDRIVMERGGDGEPTSVHRIRFDRKSGRSQWAHLATLPTQELVGEGPPVPYLVLSGLGATEKGAARVRCVRTALPPFRPELSHLFPPPFVAGVASLRRSWARMLPGEADEVLIHAILPFCSNDWFAVEEEEEEEEREEDEDEDEDEDENYVVDEYENDEEL